LLALVTLRPLLARLALTRGLLMALPFSRLTIRVLRRRGILLLRLLTGLIALTLITLVLVLIHCVGTSKALKFARRMPH
jgi:hypothetical protein